jgi:hypothetical protein
MFHHILNERTLAAFYSNSPNKNYLETFFIFILVALVFLPTLNNHSFSNILSKDIISLETAFQISILSNFQIISPQIEMAYRIFVIVYFFLLL